MEVHICQSPKTMNFCYTGLILERVLAVTANAIVNVQTFLMTMAIKVKNICSPSPRRGNRISHAQPVSAATGYMHPIYPMSYSPPYDLLIVDF
jgi:hypothetical protein